MRPPVVLCLAFLVIVSLTHLLRVVFSVPITVGQVPVPMWPSMLAFVGLGALALWLWWDQRTAVR